MADEARKTILIVDDEELVAESYEHYLSDEYDTRIATSGGEALAEIDPRDGTVDLVLLDRRMPGMSGDVVAEHIADYELDYQVIMVSAVDPDVDVVNLPCDGYLTKPVSEDDVVGAVEKALLVDDYHALIQEYNAATEKYELLSDEFSSSEVPKALQSLEARKEELEAEIAEAADQLADSKLRGAFSPTA